MRRIRAADQSGSAERGISMESSGRLTGNQQIFSFIFIQAANLLLLIFPHLFSFFALKGTNQSGREQQIVAVGSGAVEHSSRVECGVMSAGLAI